MPLDGHNYLVSQGWSGKGTGLRRGAIARPIAIPQKRSLAGVGKDRDEAFPFWDHLFNVAAKSIQVKVSGDDSDTDTPDSGPSTATVPLNRTSTGILSTRRPIPSSSSGTATPDTIVLDQPRYSLLASAKREAARRGLYARFYRGEVVGVNEDKEEAESSIHDEGEGRATSTKRKRKAQISEGNDSCEGEDDVSHREKMRLREERGALKETKRVLRALKKARKAERRAARAIVEDRVADSKSRATQSGGKKRRKEKMAPASPDLDIT